MSKKVSIPLGKLELGSGKRPTPGYIHSDVTPLKGLDIVSAPWDIYLPDGCLEEVIALGVVEHHTFKQVEQTGKNIHRMLVKGGKFIFDVPDIFVWSDYFYKSLRGQKTPFTPAHVMATMYGWQRWPGDEHKSAWTEKTIVKMMKKCGFKKVIVGDKEWLARKELHRRRLFRPEDAHIRIVAVK